MFNRAEFVREFDATGSVIVPGVLEPGFIAAAKRELEAAMEAEVRYHGTRDYKEYGMVLLCSLYGGAVFCVVLYSPTFWAFHSDFRDIVVVFSCTSIVI